MTTTMPAAPGLLKSARSRNWTSDEDREILAAVARVGLTEWNEVASELAARLHSTKSAKQCRERWFTRLDPAIDHSPWTDADEERLARLVDTHGRSWATIAQFFPGRPPSQLKNKFYARARRINRRLQREHPGAPPMIPGRSGGKSQDSPTPTPFSRRSSSSSSDRSREPSLPPTPTPSSTPPSIGRGSGSGGGPRRSRFSAAAAVEEASAAAAVVAATTSQMRRNATSARADPGPPSPATRPCDMPRATMTRTAQNLLSSALMHRYNEPQSGNSRRGSLASHSVMPMLNAAADAATGDAFRRLSLSQLAALGNLPMVPRSPPLAPASPSLRPTATASSGDPSSSATATAERMSKFPMPVKHEEEPFRRCESPSTSLFPVPQVAFPPGGIGTPRAPRHVFPLDFFHPKRPSQHSSSPRPHSPLNSRTSPHGGASKEVSRSLSRSPSSYRPILAGAGAGAAGQRRNAPRRKRARSPAAAASAATTREERPRTSTSIAASASAAAAAAASPLEPMTLSPRVLSPAAPPSPSPAHKRARVDPHLASPLLAALVTQSQQERQRRRRDSRVASPSPSPTPPPAAATKSTRDIGCQTELWYAPTVVVPMPPPVVNADADIDSVGNTDADARQQQRQLQKHCRRPHRERHHDQLRDGVSPMPMPTPMPTPTLMPTPSVHYAAMVDAWQKLMGASTSASCPPPPDMSTMPATSTMPADAGASLPIAAWRVPPPPGSRGDADADPGRVPAPSPSSRRLPPPPCQRFPSPSHRRLPSPPADERRPCGKRSRAADESPPPHVPRQATKRRKISRSTPSRDEPQSTFPSRAVSPLASPALARRITPPPSPPPHLASVSPPPPMITSPRKNLRCGGASPIPMANIRPPPMPTS